MRKYKLVISYDGTDYGGWQIQPNAPSIQDRIQYALKTALRLSDPVTLIGAGRTDAGVHAIGQVAHFTTPAIVDTFRLLGSLNGILPPEIRIRSIETAHDDFHARFDAIAKKYTYHLHLDRVLDPFRRRFTTHVLYPLDLDLLAQGAAYFVGTHDFTSFSNESHQEQGTKNCIRTIYKLELHPEPGGIRLEFEGNGFLYKMVRTIVGTLLDVGSGKVQLEQIPEIFAAKDRRAASQAASPQGLFLTEVIYS